MPKLFSVINTGNGQQIDQLTLEAATDIQVIMLCAGFSAYVINTATREFIPTRGDWRQGY